MKQNYFSLLRFFLWHFRVIAVFVAFCVAGFSLPVSAQTQRFAAGVDTVFSVRWGAGQDFGRERFPANVLGLPDSAARANTPSANPLHICSLGMGGEIVIGWGGAILRDGEGADFTIFENAFTRFDGRVFAEPAKVAVSKDGVHFVEFPFDSLTLKGCAGVTPTNGDQNPFDPAVSGGDSFDLRAIGMDSVRFIKITDISAMVLNNPKHPFFDPTISGFDLDAVVGLSLEAAPNLVVSARAEAFPRAFREARHPQLTVQNGEILVDFAEPPPAEWRAELYNALGARVGESPNGFAFGSRRIVSPAGGLPRGMYFLVLHFLGTRYEMETRRFVAP
jgi:hypothetical protein